MALYINSIKNGSTAYNIHNGTSTKLNKIKMGNTDVWQGIPENYYTYKTKIQNSALTQSEWIDFIESGCKEAAIKLGETGSFIGKKITIANSQTPEYSSWIIIDFNHGNTSNTCDVQTENTVITYDIQNSSNVMDYKTGRARSFLIGNYLNGFDSQIKNLLKTMNVPIYTSDDSSTLQYLSDKVTLPSCTELGGVNANAPEGVRYPLYPNGNNNADSSRIKAGASTNWWTRSRYFYTGGYYYLVGANGAISRTNGTSYLGLAPIIRF